MIMGCLFVFVMEEVDLTERCLPSSALEPRI